MVLEDRTRTHPNATVHRTVACRASCGVNSLIFAQRAKIQIESYMVRHINAPKALVFGVFLLGTLEIEFWSGQQTAQSFPASSRPGRLCQDVHSAKQK
jgi:hypothetical protein